MAAKNSPIIWAIGSRHEGMYWGQRGLLDASCELEPESSSVGIESRTSHQYRAPTSEDLFICLFRCGILLSRRPAYAKNRALRRLIPITPRHSCERQRVVNRPSGPEKFTRQKESRNVSLQVPYETEREQQHVPGSIQDHLSRTPHRLKLTLGSPPLRLEAS